jgi:hypothetical protein
MTEAKARKNAGPNFKTFCCEPCGYLYCEVPAACDVAERVMMLDLEASAQLGAMQ